MPPIGSTHGVSLIPSVSPLSFSNARFCYRIQRLQRNSIQYPCSWPEQPGLLDSPDLWLARNWFPPRPEGTHSPCPRLLRMDCPLHFRILYPHLGLLLSKVRRIPFFRYLYSLSFLLPENTPGKLPFPKTREWISSTLAILERYSSTSSAVSLMLCGRPQHTGLWVPCPTTPPNWPTLPDSVRVFPYCPLCRTRLMPASLRQVTPICRCCRSLACRCR